MFAKGIDPAEYLNGFVEIIKEGPLHLEEFKVTDFELTEFLLSGEEYIMIEQLRDRAIEKCAGLGLHTVAYLLANQNEIPDSWRKDHQGNSLFTIFPATIVRSKLEESDGLFVPAIFWDDDDGWCLNFFGLDDQFNSSDRLLTACS